MSEPSGDSHPIVSFADYELRPTERQLLHRGMPVALGDRAFDLLLVLATSEGRAVGKSELIERVWPGRVVAENALQAQVTALRRALGADRGLILTVSGRGYQFTGRPDSAVPSPVEVAAAADLPHRTFELVGRDAALDMIRGLVRSNRLVTIVGPGGVGKTQVAFEIGRRMAAEFSGSVAVVELSEQASADAVQTVLAPAVARTAAARLVLLDGCARWIGVAASLAEKALRKDSALRLLVTSREPLRVEGESVFRLPPLGIAAAPFAGEAIDDAAARLFWRRYTAAGGPAGLEHSHDDAVSRICRGLDALPLAIDMAAVRAARVGIEWVASHLEQPLSWLNAASRTTDQRHRSMRASLEWSLDALAPTERLALRRLCELAGAFSLEDACRSLHVEGVTTTDAIDLLSALVAKSLIDRDGASRDVRYRIGHLARCASRPQTAGAESA